MTNSSSNNPRPDVLIVDDNTDLCATLQHLLEEDGWSVRCAYTSTEAIQRVNDLERPTIVLLDRNLCDHRRRHVLGEKLLKELEWRARYPIVTFFFSADHTPEAESVALAAGAKGYIFKNRDPHFLVLAKLEVAATIVREQTEPNEDHLTGAMNRRALFDQGVREMSRAEREGATMAVLLVDVDRLKPVNDTYGHAVGDRLLTSTVTSIRSHMRITDVLGRHGGDEFVLLLSNFDETMAADFVNKMCETISRQSINVDDEHPEEGTIGVSASVGISIIHPLEIREEIQKDGPSEAALKNLLAEHIKLADDRMYEEKEGKKARRAQ